MKCSLGRVVCILFVGLPIAIVTLIGAWLAACLMHVDGHAGARSNPVNLLLAHNILPRAGGATGRWSTHELEPRAQDLQQELTAGGLWKEIRDEYLTWENNHTQRGDAAPFACQEFPWQRTLSFRMLSKDTSLVDSGEFPVIAKLLKRYPWVPTLNVFTLEPGFAMSPHRGPFAGAIRLQLGLESPPSTTNAYFALCREKEYFDPGDWEGNQDRCCSPAPPPPLPSLESSSTSNDNASVHSELPSRSYVTIDCQDTSEWDTFRWENGESFVFDDNNLHFVVNDGPGRRIVLTLDFPRPNLPLHVRLFNEVLLRAVFPRVPDLARYSDAFSAHYESLLQRPASSVLPPPKQKYYGSSTDVDDASREQQQDSTCPNGICPAHGATPVRCAMETIGDIDVDITAPSMDSARSK